MCGLVFLQGQNKEREIEKSLKEIDYRGPDSSYSLKFNNMIFGFNRLSVMDLSNYGDQPFSDDEKIVMCNGEIYNYKKLKDKDYNYLSNSDCEILMSLYKKEYIKNFITKLDGEFAFVIFDKSKNKLLAARDHLGIRPLFYGYDDEGLIQFSSEVKSIQSFTNNIKPFPPGHYYEDGKFVEFYSFDSFLKTTYTNTNLEDSLIGIKENLVEGIKKRLSSDAPIAYLLSGGLDSSLVCAIAQKYSKEKIKTFSVGINQDPIDVKYAKIVADHIGSDHTTYLFTEKDVLENLDILIKNLESWDVTTIRASIGMFLVCKYIKENTNIKVLMTGEVSDELFGYKYTDYAPNPEEFQKESIKRMKELYLYDVLRADRCISSNSLEARVPFSDKEFVNFVMDIDPKLKMNTYNMGKYLLRKAFDNGELLPKDILYRQKAAFSDAVGHRSVDYLKELAEKKYSDEEFNKKIKFYSKNIPNSKEELMYREIFNKYYSCKEDLIPSLWLPNKNWENCDVTDPSARVLPNYGKSGE